jgi:DNA-binding response OmpR family regulator
MRCLVADRSATMRGIVTRGLRRAGATDVVAASTLDEAYAACETVFELAVIDRDLSEGLNWNWLGELREKACAEGRLIVTGTRVTRAEGEVLRALGVSTFVLKPLQPEALAERVRALLALGDAGEEGEEPQARAA